MDMSVLAVPIVMGLMLAVKMIPPLRPESRHWVLPWLAIGLATGLVVLHAYTGEAPGFSPDLILSGIIYGLASVGLYEGTVDKLKKIGG